MNSRSFHLRLLQTYYCCSFCEYHRISRIRIIKRRLSEGQTIDCNNLGYGAYSEVYKVIRLSDDKEYALKKVKLMHDDIKNFKVKMGDLSDKEKENALNEIRILASIR